MTVNTFSWLFTKNTHAYNQMMAFKDNLKRLMDRGNLSQYRLSQLSGVPQPTILRALNGSNPRSETVKKLAEALGVGATELIGDSINENGPEYAANGTTLAESNIDAQARQKNGFTPRRIPVFTDQDILERKTASDAHESGREHVSSDTDVSAYAYGWRVSTSELGDLNLPFTTPVMATLIIEPEAKPKSGDWIIVTDSNNNVMVKKYELDPPHIYIHSLKARHEPFMLDESYIINGVVVSINLKTR